MSYDFNAYVSRALMPEPSAFRARLLSLAGIELPQTDDLTSLRGFLQVICNGASSGFELSWNPIDDKQRNYYREDLRRAGAGPDEFLSILMISDLDVSFHATGQREIESARIVASTLASMSKGWFCDPQRGETIGYRVG